MQSVLRQRLIANLLEANLDAAFAQHRQHGMHLVPSRFMRMGAQWQRHGVFQHASYTLDD